MYMHLQDEKIATSGGGIRLDTCFNNHKSNSSQHKIIYIYNYIYIHVHAWIQSPCSHYISELYIVHKYYYMYNLFLT